jgi:hypothetical protein
MKFIQVPRVTATKEVISTTMVSTIGKRKNIGHEPNSQRTFTILLFVVSPWKLVLVALSVKSL